MITVDMNEKENLIRMLRESECFSVINRGKLWYDSLTVDEYNELKKWYIDWLDAPETKIIPTTPNFVNKKVLFEEDII